MALHTLAQALNRSQINALAQSLQVKGMTVDKASSYVSARNKDGVKVLSAISGKGTSWSVMVTEALAAELNLPLWKDCH